MRRFLSTIFIVSFCSHASWADITCTISATTKCEAGCYISTSYGCTVCDNGEYTSGGEKYKCEKCVGPQNATNITFTSPGTSEKGCSWTATCPAGKQYTGGQTGGCEKICDNGTFSPEKMKISGTGYGTDQLCNQACGANSQTNEDGTGCKCNPGYHIYGESNEDTSNNDKDCVANKYTITYDPNGGTGNKLTEHVKFNDKITLKNNETFSRSGYTLTGWQVQQDTATVYAPNQTITYNTYYDNITLLAQWTGEKFTITYNTGNANCTNITPQECQFGNTSTCKPDTTNCSYPGYILTGWTCTGCDNGSSNTIEPGADIFKLYSGQDITLTAKWEPCTAGYYCTNGTKYPCPAGSTSEAGKSQIQDCYMVGGTTKFCDQAGNCFTLPTGQTIKYKTNQ